MIFLTLLIRLFRVINVVFNDCKTKQCLRLVKVTTALQRRDCAVVRAIASHQCVPGSIPGPGGICGLSLLLVLFLAPRGFSLGTQVFPSPQKPTILIRSGLLSALCHEPLARLIAQALPV